tara:strand:+ start:320 stop:547 length:228 start_codon:yes stop_codon:yes gene_type:complete
MIKYNGCENEGHYIDPFLCCGQTEQELKARKGNDFIIIEYIPKCNKTKQQRLKDLTGNDIIVIAKKGIDNEPRVR